MTTVYILTFKKTGKRFCYTSLRAMSLSHSEEEFQVAQVTIAHLKFKDNLYENSSIIIEKFKGIGMGDIRKSRDEDNN